MNHIQQETKIGIDSISFYTPKNFINLNNIKTDAYDLNKYLQRIGQKISSQALDESIIDMAVKAIKNIENDFNYEDIDYIIFATESSFDNSRSAGLYLKDKINIPQDISFFEIKQACYSSTAAIIFAISYIKVNPLRKVLIVASDISKYQDNTPAELTAGSGAIAMVISSDPKIIKINNNITSSSLNVLDFYKPIKENYPVVNGLLSIETYCKLFEKTYFQYINQSSADKQTQIIVPHLPYVNIIDLLQRKFFKNSTLFLLEEIKYYSSLIGNSYTASLYINLCSLLDNAGEDLSNKEIGLYAFGSGAVASFFTGNIQKGYKKYLKKYIHLDLLKERISK
jgi:hydroxymethylglutaryl-CoA synthase